MAKYYITVADSMTQATTTFASVQTLPDGGTLSSIKVPPGMSRISVIGVAVTHDVVAIADTGNNFTLQISGTGSVDGIQELYAGSVASQTTGTSVTGTLSLRPAFYRPVNIRVKPGEINVAAAFDGTDGGSPFLAVTLGFD